jgi:hypothetical protein
MRIGSVGSCRWVGIIVGVLLWGAPCSGAPLSPLAIPRTPLLLTEFSRQPAPPPSAPRPLSRRLRAGTVSLGIQGQIGGITGGSELTDHYSFGPGYGIRFRYQLSRGAALGFSFEHQRYDAVGGLPPNPDPNAGDSTLVITTVAAEGMAFLHRERETVPYFLGGFGYASPDVVYHGAGTRRVNEGPFLVLGVGFEHFVRERFSIDAAARGFGQIGNSELTLATQIALGIHLYPGD